MFHKCSSARITSAGKIGESTDAGPLQGGRVPAVDNSTQTLGPQGLRKLSLGISNEHQRNDSVSVCVCV